MRHSLWRVASKSKFLRRHIVGLIPPPDAYQNRLAHRAIRPCHVLQCSMFPHLRTVSISISHPKQFVEDCIALKKMSIAPIATLRSLTLEIGYMNAHADVLTHVLPMVAPRELSQLIIHGHYPTVEINLDVLCGYPMLIELGLLEMRISQKNRDIVKQLTNLETVHGNGLFSSHHAQPLSAEPHTFQKLQRLHLPFSTLDSEFVLRLAALPTLTELRDIDYDSLSFLHLLPHITSLHVVGFRNRNALSWIVPCNLAHLTHLTLEDVPCASREDDTKFDPDFSQFLQRLPRLVSLELKRCGEGLTTLLLP